MAKKISVKTTIAIFLLCAVVMALCACMSPVDIQAFLKDKEVQDLITATKVSVKIEDLTGDNLTERDRRIEGLKNNKYYMVEKEISDEDNLPVTGYPKFVTDHHPISPQIPGALHGELRYITRIKDGRINGLINYHTYTVRAAEPLAPSDGKLSYADDVGSASKQIDVINGTITITNIIGTGNNGYLDLSSVITADYEVMAVFPVTEPQSSPWDWYSKTPASWDSFELEGENTEIDYVFFKDNGNSSPDFYFLSVVIGPTVEPVPLTIDIVFNIVDETPTFSPNDGTFHQSEYYGTTQPIITINVSDINDYSVVEWKYDGNSVSLGNNVPFVLNNVSDIDYFAVGNHTLTIIVTKDGKPYSADFTFTVVP